MSNSTLLDGQFTRGIYVNRPSVEYPFQVNGDRRAAVIARDFRVRESTYVPGQSGVEKDPSWPNAYLMSEGLPLPSQVVDVLRMQRIFATVPADQVTYGSRVITKPTAASAGGAVSSTQFFYNSAGLLLGNYTTFLAHVFAPNNAVYGPEASTSSVDNGADTRVTWTAHGLAGTENIETRATGWGGGDPRRVTAAGGYTVVDANTIDILGFNLGATVQQAGKYLRDYTPGTDRVGLRVTQKFYLPGVTTGITTAADIPLPSLLVNDVALITAVLANTTGYQTYDASEIARWRDWPTYTQTLEEINMADL